MLGSDDEMAALLSSYYGTLSICKAVGSHSRFLLYSSVDRFGENLPPSRRSQDILESTPVSERVILLF